MSTTLIKSENVVRKWYLVDAAGVPAGRLAVKIANLLRGRGKPDYTPSADNGDFVVVINAEKVRLTGAKESTKLYKSFSGFPSGLKEVPAGEVRKFAPTRILEHAVKGMLPRNTTRRARMVRLKIYAGDKHPHAAQQPIVVK